MRLRNLFAIPLIISILGSCRGNDQRRATPQEPINNLKATVNANWKIAYNNRHVEITDGNTLILDEFNLESKDDRKFIFYISEKSLLNEKYSGDILKFMSGLTEEFKGKPDAAYDKLRIGNTVEKVYALGSGKTNDKYIAIMVGYDPKTGITGDYSLLEYKPNALQLKKTEDWKLSYNGRNAETKETILTSRNDKMTYYVECVKDNYVDLTYKGNLEDFFNARLDNLAKELNEDEQDFSRLLYQGNMTILFDRFSAGNWKIYAFGVDLYGYFTGEYSEASFTIEEETPTAEYNKWIGKWDVTGTGPEYNDNGDFIGNKTVTYPIEIDKSEANYTYIISGWELGVDAKTDEYLKNYSFEADFIKSNGNLEFKGYDADMISYEDDSQYLVMFTGNYQDGNDFRTMLDPYPLASAALDDTGKNAVIRGKSFTQDGKTLQFNSMQFVDILLDEQGKLATDKDGNFTVYVYTNITPEFPLSMRYTGELSPSPSARQKLSGKMIATKAPEMKGRLFVKSTSTDVKYTGSVRKTERRNNYSVKSTINRKFRKR